MKVNRKGKSPVACLVVGCTETVPNKAFYQRCKICPKHSKMPFLEVDGGERVRLCHLCKRFQPVSDFDGERRSCRKMLEAHNARRRNRRITGEESNGAGSGEETDSSTSVGHGQEKGMDVEGSNTGLGGGHILPGTQRRGRRSQGTPVKVVAACGSQQMQSEALHSKDASLQSNISAAAEQHVSEAPHAQPVPHIQGLPGLRHASPCVVRASGSPAFMQRAQQEGRSPSAVRAASMAKAAGRVRSGKGALHVGALESMTDADILDMLGWLPEWLEGEPLREIPSGSVLPHAPQPTNGEDTMLPTFASLNLSNLLPPTTSDLAAGLSLMQTMPSLRPRTANTAAAGSAPQNPATAAAGTPGASVPTSWLHWQHSGRQVQPSLGPLGDPPAPAGQEQPAALPLPSYTRDLLVGMELWLHAAAGQLGPDRTQQPPPSPMSPVFATTAADYSGTRQDLHAGAARSEPQQKQRPPQQKQPPSSPSSQTSSHSSPSKRSASELQQPTAKIHRSTGPDAQTTGPAALPTTGSGFAPQQVPARAGELSAGNPSEPQPLPKGDKPPRGYRKAGQQQPAAGSEMWNPFAEHRFCGPFARAACLVQGKSKDQRGSGGDGASGASPV